MLTKIISYLSFVIPMMVLVGCDTSALTPTPDLSSTATNKVQTLVPATVTPTSTPSITSNPTTSQGAIPFCQERGDHFSLPQNFGLSGTLIYTVKNNDNILTFGGNPLKKSDIVTHESNGVHVFGFSPDGKWLAYTPLRYDKQNLPILVNPTIKLLSATGDHQESTLNTDVFADKIPADNRLFDFSTYGYWINNNLILTTLFFQKPSPLITGPFGQLIDVFDPFKGIWRDDLNILPRRNYSFSIGISPDLSRALFEGDNLTLWDLNNNIPIWNSSFPRSTYGSMIYWAPNSSQAAYSQFFTPPDNNGVLLITRDGQEKSIYNFQYPSPQNLIVAMSWSPDSRYLALAGASQIGAELTIYIYDTQINQYISQCPIAQSTDMTPFLYWSPDSSAIVYTARDSPILFLDIQSGRVYELVQNGFAYGWSGEFPTIWPH